MSKLYVHVLNGQSINPHRQSQLKVTENVFESTILLALCILTQFLLSTLIYWQSKSYFIISLNRWGHFGWVIWSTTLIEFSLKTTDSTEHREFQEKDETQSPAWEKNNNPVGNLWNTETTPVIMFH